VKWKTLGEVEVPDILQFVKDAAAAGEAVHVGTDSLQDGRYTRFITVVAVLKPSKGGRAAYSQEITPRMTSLRERLMKEVWRSVELGMLLAPLLPDEVKLNVHVDANPNEKFMSSKYVQELVGLVVGQGFNVKIKPDSWAATHAADHIVRVKSKTPRHLRVVGGRKAS
jgi:uncharacterized protein